MELCHRAGQGGQDALLLLRSTVRHSTAREGAANKKAFGVDRAANPWSDILNTEVVWISGANIAECAPIRNFTVGFDEVAASVKEWTPQRTAQVTGIAEKAIRQAAEWWGQAKTSFLMHARGIEHHTHGVLNCLGAINLVLASGDVAHGN